MLQSITQSQLLPILLAIAAFLVAALLILYIFRLLFGRRIRATGSRNRPRRLDVVDAFDLDRERQLVIVRRDNIEHLLLIGGPNDLLVEGAINRGEAAIARPEPREARPPAPGWPPAPHPANRPRCSRHFASAKLLPRKLPSRSTALSDGFRSQRAGWNHQRAGRSQRERQFPLDLRNRRALRHRPLQSLRCPPSLRCRPISSRRPRPASSPLPRKRRRRQLSAPRRAWAGLSSRRAPRLHAPRRPHFSAARRKSRRPR